MTLKKVVIRNWNNSFVNGNQYHNKLLRNNCSAIAIEKAVPKYKTLTYIYASNMQGYQFIDSFSLMKPYRTCLCFHNVL